MEKPQLEEILKRIKNKYSAYENELNSMEDDDEDGEFDGILDVSVLCDLADSIPFLIETIEKQQQKIEHLADIVDSCECNND